MTETPDETPDRLDEALANLPPRAASPGFTRRVLTALDDRASSPGPARGPQPRVWALAAAAALAIAVGVFLGARPEPPVAALATERESLRLEHDELMRELESLRSLARETRPVLYLGSGDDVDYVLDLSPLVERSAAARPASLENTSAEPRFY